MFDFQLKYFCAQYSPPISRIFLIFAETLRQYSNLSHIDFCLQSDKFSNEAKLAFFLRKKLENRDNFG